ncbi:Protein of unknown function [Cotesia congregata]|uniref:Uncharacterized protein n=1 Tax=Cotesia congregata TaxID=51543 RepID=A0A8J2EC89_COTCN|nr:Protein of unknown function [Cotesia congregata]
MVNKMCLMNKKGKNLYTFAHEFKLPTNSEWVKLPAFTIEDIPSSEFDIIAQVAYDYSEKSYLRPAVAIITVQLTNQEPLVDRVVHWEKIFEVNNLILSYTSNTCPEKKEKPVHCMGRYHTFCMTISCSIFWHGFVEDLYCLDVCKHVQDHFKSHEFSDVKIKVEDNEFFAHK